MGENRSNCVLSNVVFLGVPGRDSQHEKKGVPQIYHVHVIKARIIIIYAR